MQETPKDEGEPLRIEAATISAHGAGGKTSTSLVPASLVPLVEGEPLLIEGPTTSAGTEVQTLTIPALTVPVREVETARTKAPAALCPPSRTTVEPSAS